MSTTTLSPLAERVEAYLEELCVRIANRHVGSPGNQRAAGFFRETIAAFGFRTETPSFDCLDWEQGGAALTLAGEAFAALVSPYSPACDLSAPLIPVANLDELASAELTGRIAFLHSQLTTEQLMPKDYPFYYPEEHRRIIELLEKRQPAAIIAATGKNRATTGGLNPFPLFEDGNFNIPSAYMTKEEGARLLQHTGLHPESPASLRIDSRRIPSQGCNVIARKGRDHSRRVLFCAHLDTKKETPGAIDNATGVAALLSLAELLRDYEGDLGLEIVAMNGEDYYAAPGELQYLALNDGKLGELLLMVNLDGAGYREGGTAYSLYNCSGDLTSAVGRHLTADHGCVEGQPWYQSDHMVFAAQGVPAVAVTSEKFFDPSTNVTHTPADRPELVDARKVAALAEGLRDLFLELANLRR